MKLLFLRGKLPLDFRPDRLPYNTIEECEDMWTVLAERISRKLDHVELWYHGAGNSTRKKSVTNKFRERWINISKLPNYQPDVILARGGMPEYPGICKKFPKAKKIYYGAGIRFKPQGGKWDLVLVDSEKQQKQIPGSKPFIKPAADLFRPVKVEKKYDVCFMANAPQAEIKQHKLAFDSLAETGISILHLGLVDGRLKKWARNTNVTFGGWCRRHKLPGKMSQCKIGLVCSTSYDSCPRVLPEYLACGLPVVALKEMNFWHEKYINDQTGILCSRNDIDAAVRLLLKVKLNVRSYYQKNLSMDVAANMLLELIK